VIAARIPERPASAGPTVSAVESRRRRALHAIVETPAIVALEDLNANVALTASAEARRSNPRHAVDRRPDVPNRLPSML